MVIYCVQILDCFERIFLRTLNQNIVYILPETEFWFFALINKKVKSFSLLFWGKWQNPKNSISWPKIFQIFVLLYLQQWVFNIIWWLGVKSSSTLLREFRFWNNLSVSHCFFIELRLWIAEKSIFDHFGPPKMDPSWQTNKVLKFTSKWQKWKLWAKNFFCGTRFIPKALKTDSVRPLPIFFILIKHLILLQ